MSMITNLNFKKENGISDDENFELSLTESDNDDNNSYATVNLSNTADF